MKSLAILTFHLIILLSTTAKASFLDSVNHYYALAKSSIEIEESITNAQKALDFSKKHGNDSLQLEMLHFLGWRCFFAGEYHKSRDIAFEQRELALKIKDTANIISSASFIGNTYTVDNDFDKAIEWYDTGLNLAFAAKDTHRQAVIYNNLGRCYLELQNSEHARTFLKKALHTYKLARVPDSELLPLYGNIADTETSAEAANEVLNHALQFAEDTIGDLKIFLLSQKGKINKEFGNYEEAIKAYKEACDFEKAQGNVSASVTMLPMLAELYLLANKVNKAQQTIEEYYSIEGKFRGEQEDLSGHKVAANIYETLGKFPKAFHYANKVSRISDSLYQKDIDDKFVEYNAKFKAEEKDKEIAQQKLDLAQQELQIQKQRSQRQQTLIGSILALLLSAIAFQYYLQKQKRKKQAAEHQLQLQQAETESLKKLDELKTQFFTNVSHELRTPLTLINGPLENALQNTKDRVQQKSIATAFKNSKKLSNLVDEILDFSKLEAGKLELQPKNVELNHFIKRIFTAFDSMADIRGIKLNYNSNIAQNIYVKVDDNKLEKIINNLVSNAIKFTKRNGSVSFNADLNQSQLSIQVEDNGSGIHADDLPYVFERFYQSQQKSESLQGGTGIGLALSKELAELMKGNLSVKSEWQQGSTFELTIPIEITDSNVQSGEESLENIEDDTTPVFTPLFINGKKPKILIVEDNYEMSRYLNELLSEEYNCTIAHDGQEALKKLKQQSFDLISADVMMPNMDGFTFREKVNKDERFRGIPFIMLTARAIEEDKLKGLQLGVDDYITKPFSKLELKARIHNLLLNKIQRDEWKQQREEQEDTPNVELSFIQQVEMIVLKNIDNTDFKVNDLAESMNYSQRQLSRILKKHIGLSPVAYILEIRLQKARQLLEQKKYNSIKEVQFEVGIDSASYFTSKFKERFGKSPSEYV